MTAAGPARGVADAVPSTDEVLIRVVTAADEAFARTLWQYLTSVKRQGITEDCEWIAYDLGLSAVSRKILEAAFPWCTFKTFAFSSCPPHVALQRRNFAWKPCIVASEMERHHGIVFWFDCATVFRRNLGRLVATVKHHGLWYLRGQTALAENTDSRTLAAMNAPPETFHLAEIAAGALGFLTSNTAAANLVKRWRELALQEHILDPQPRGTAKHRFDQSILSALVFELARKGHVALLNDEIDISSACPVADIATRNKVARWIPQWADPLVRFYYATYKSIDRFWLGGSRWMTRRVGGLRRHVVEHFRITVHDQATGLTRDIPSPRFGYFADPFVWIEGGETYVFAEEFDCSRDRGELVVMKLDNLLNVVSCQALQYEGAGSAISCHASFPFLFRFDGNVYMLPETCARNSVDLFICVEWPAKWRLMRRLLFGIDAADSALIEKEGKWWLLTSVRSGHDNRHLAIYDLADLHRDVPVSHPINAERLYSGMVHGTGRNAGFVSAQHDGTIIRLIQDSTLHYGEGAAFRRVVILDQERFREEACAAPDELPAIVPATSCHHVSVCGSLCAWDRRTRASPWAALLGKC